MKAEEIEKIRSSTIFIRPWDSIRKTRHNFHPRDAFGSGIHKGNWRAYRDLAREMSDDRLPETIDLADDKLYRAMYSVFFAGADWADTDFYRSIVENINSGQPMWGCKTEGEFRKRVDVDIANIFGSIARNGYLSQIEIMDLQKSENSTQNNDFQNFKPGKFYDKIDAYNEVKIGFSASGEIIFLEGRHRLCAARLIGVPRIPALVMFRSTSWIALRDELRDRSKAGGACYLDHPDLDSFRYSTDAVPSILRKLKEMEAANICVRMID